MQLKDQLDVLSTGKVFATDFWVTGGLAEVVYFEK